MIHHKVAIQRPESNSGHSTAVNSRLRSAEFWKRKATETREKPKALTAGVMAHLAYPSFNPGLGFLSVATGALEGGLLPAVLFQSRSGFSLRRDCCPNLSESDCLTVSIPVWVFSPSRRGQSVATRIRSSFNPGLGFLSVATVIVEPAVDVGDRFNPGLGFLSVATSVDPPQLVRADAFQSRSGFSLRRDGLLTLPSKDMIEFQSRSGFSLRRDVQKVAEKGRYHRFNPGLGFLSVATGAGLATAGPGTVSIPVWVFSPSRPSWSSSWCSF